MKIIHRHILAEIGAPYLIALFAFTLVTMLHRFSRLADLLVAKGVPASLVGKVLLSLVPAFLSIALPAALLLSVLLAFGRMGADSEITALCTAGVGMRGLLLPVLLFSTATFFVNLAIGWAGIPWGHRVLTASLARIVSVRAGAGIQEHVFQEVAPGVLLFPDRVSPDGTGIYGVMLSQRVEGQDPLLVFAKEGRFLPESEGALPGLVLSEGAIHNDDWKEGAYRIARFREMEFRLPKAADDAAQRTPPKSFTLLELGRMASDLEKGRRRGSYWYDFHRRLALAASCLAFGLLAIPLGLSQRTRGKSPALASTLAIILIFYIFFAVAGALGEFSLPLMIALMWLPNVVGLGAACWLLWRSEIRMILLPDWFGKLAGKK